MGVYGEVYEKGIVGKEGKGSAVGEGVALTCLLSFAPFDGVSVTALDVIYNSSSSTSRSSGSYSSYSSSIVDYTVLFGSETGAIRVFSLRAKRSARPSNDCNESIGDIGGIGGIGGVEDESTWEEKVTPTHLLTVPSKHQHTATVKKLRWRKTSSIGGIGSIGGSMGRVNEMMFASCGEDTTVRVHRLMVNQELTY